ncbi:hypothetical protein LJC36_04040, partial [Desulfovibrio sp. OttesenSCG-928-C14]|nr:hypothetical protein [Desulfovibrio sp. OttesenSCG-928-C14]
AYGIPALKVSSYEELKNNADKIMYGKGPFICEAMVDPDEQALPRLQSSMDENGHMVSKPLEDLYPFLPSEELAENMK